MNPGGTITLTLPPSPKVGEGPGGRATRKKIPHYVRNDAKKIPAGAGIDKSRRVLFHQQQLAALHKGVTRPQAVDISAAGQARAVKGHVITARRQGFIHQQRHALT